MAWTVDTSYSGQRAIMHWVSNIDYHIEVKQYALNIAILFCHYYLR